jgi:hypothetical protein
MRLPIVGAPSERCSQCVLGELGIWISRSLERKIYMCFVKINRAIAANVERILHFGIGVLMVLLVGGLVGTQPAHAQETGEAVRAVAQPGDPEVQLVKVVDELADPVNIAAPDDGTGRIFVVERIGRIRIVEDGEMLLSLSSTYKVLSRLIFWSKDC